MAIKIKKKTVSDIITDENDKEIGRVSFNPDDINVYNEFMGLIDILHNTEKKDKKIGNINIPKEQLKSMDEFEQVKPQFDKVTDKLKNYENTLKQVGEKIDNIFGNGTYFLLTNGQSDIELIMPIIEWASPHFKKSRKIKVDKYLDEQSDVM